MVHCIKESNITSQVPSVFKAVICYQAWMILSFAVNIIIFF